MKQQEFELMMSYLEQYFDESEIEYLISNHPLTGFGKNGELSIRRMLGELSIEYFAKAYTDQFNQEFGDYAKEILSTLKTGIESNVQENLAVVAPRGHGKSTISSLAVPAWSAAYQKKQYIIFISANGDVARNFLGKIQRVLESPEIIKDFGHLRDKKKAWNVDELQTSTGVWIACTGWQSGLRGLNKDSRPDLIILDDLEDKAVIASESLQKKLDSFFRDELGRLGDYKTDMFYIGTLLSEDALLARVIKEASWKVLFYKRVISFPKNEKLWGEWSNIYNKLENTNRLDDAYEFYLDNKEEMLDGVKVLWEGKIPEDEVKYKGAYYHVMLDREKWGEQSFWKEDQNEPRSSKDYIFENIHYWGDDTHKLPPIEEMDLFLGVDPSMGKKNGDYSALCLMGRHKESNRKYIVESELYRLKPNELIKKIIDVCIRFPVNILGFESVNFQEYVADDLKQALKKHELYHVIVKKVKPRSNKHNRIVNMEPFVSRGEILFNKFSTQFNNQVKTYNIKAPHDDAIDVVELTFELCHKRVSKPRVIDKPVGL